MKYILVASVEQHQRGAEFQLILSVQYQTISSRLMTYAHKCSVCGEGRTPHILGFLLSCRLAELLVNVNLECT